MLTMKQARKLYADRAMVSPAFTDKEGTHHRRVNRRNPPATSFRVWARHTLLRGTAMSPKLARILDGALAAEAA